MGLCHFWRFPQRYGGFSSEWWSVFCWPLTYRLEALQHEAAPGQGASWEFSQVAVIESILHHSHLEEQLKSYHTVLWFKWNFWIPFLIGCRYTCLFLLRPILFMYHADVEQNNIATWWIFRASPWMSWRKRSILAYHLRHNVTRRPDLSWGVLGDPKGIQNSQRKTVSTGIAEESEWLTQLKTSFQFCGVKREKM